MARRSGSLKATGVYDRGTAWQVKISRADARGQLHRVNRSFAYDSEVPASHSSSRTSRFHEAAAFAAAHRSALRLERRPLHETQATQTLRAWLDRYEREETPKKKSANRERSTLAQIRVLFPDLLARQVSTLRPSDFIGHEGHSVEGIMRKVYAPATIRRYLTTFSHVFTVARSRWNYDGDHPLRGVEKPSAHDERSRIISDEEWQRIEESWGETSLTVIAAIRWLRWTAARRGEAVGLQWSDIDWTNDPPTAYLRNTKARYDAPARSRHIPLSPEAVSALETLCKGEWPTSGAVFEGVKPDSITRAWARTCERAQVEDARIHDLRHTRITEIARFLPLQILASLTGHRDPAMLMRYYNPSGKDAAAAGRAIFGGAEV